jgi:ribosomal protein S18 acetylase RimI-like enzyme
MEINMNEHRTYTEAYLDTINEAMIPETKGVTVEVDQSGSITRFSVKPEDRNQGFGTNAITKLKKAVSNLSVSKNAFNEVGNFYSNKEDKVAVERFFKKNKVSIK